MSDGNENDPIAGLNQVDQILSGTPFADTLGGQDGDDSITGGAGDDRLIGRGGSDSISGDDGNDLIRAGGGNDLLDGGDGDDVLWDGGGADRHFGRLGDDLLVGRDGADTLFGGDGFDRIYGGLDSDELSGGGGRDFVFGGADNDLIFGGEGDDKLTGGEGEDVFVIEPGSGRDVIRDFEPGVDTIDLTALDLGISFAHLRIVGMGPHTWVAFGNGDGLTLYNTDPSTLSEGDFAGLQASTTADLRLIVRSAEGAEMTGGEGADYVRGADGADVLSGGGGDDDIWDNEGDDTLSGGDGIDRIRAGAGADVLYGGVGHDCLYGGADGDALSGGDGGDFLFGDEGADTLDGGAGADILTGGAGSDRFILSSGFDVIRDFGTGDDVIDLGGRGLAFDDIQIFGVGPHTAVRLPDGNGFLLFNTSPGDLSESDFDFGETAPPPADPDSIVGTPGDDSLSAIGVNSVSGLGGNDTIDLRADFGSAFGGDGNDDVTIGLTPGSSEIAPAEAFGGAGDDTITVLDREASAEGGDGNDLINVHDTSFVDGGAGTDTLDYVGDGVAIYDASFLEFPENPAGGYVVDGQTGSARGIESLGGGIVAGIIGGNGTSGDDVIGDDDVVQASNLGVSNIFAAAGNDTVYGFAGDDSLRGQFGDDHLFGGDGDDTLGGDAGNDTLVGGAGANALTGGEGADVFVIGPATEDARITDFAVGEDHIDLRSRDIDINQISIRADGLNTILQLSDGSSIFLAGIHNSNVTEDIFVGLLPTATPGTDIAGSGGDDSIDAEGVTNLLGLAGNDTLDLVSGFGEAFGGDGNDAISVDTGGDASPLASARAYGGAGDDLITISGPDAHAFGGDGDDTLNVSSDDFAVIDSATGTMMLGGRLSSVWGIEHVTGNGGFGTLFRTGLQDGTTGADLIADVGTGTFENSIIQAGADNDTVFGGEGNDSIRGQYGDDLIYGGEGFDLLEGNAGNDTLHGGGGFNVLEGGSGADVLTGGAGVDLLDGGAGYDTLTGGAGLDFFALGTAGGVDLITDFTSGEDFLVADSLEAGFADIEQVVSGEDLILRVSGSDIVRLSNVSTLTELDFVGFGDDLTYEEVNGLPQVTGTESDDIFLYGVSGQHFGLGGNDRFENVIVGDFYGGDGEDTLSFGLETVCVDQENGLYATQQGVMGRFEGIEVLEGNILSLVEPVGDDIGTVGDDLIFGGLSEDVFAGDGNDTIHGPDFIQIRYGAGEQHGGAGDDLFIGGSENEVMYGGAGNDTLLGNERGDRLFGGDGDDLLVGGDFGSLNNNKVGFYGGDGNDTMIAGDMSAFMQGDAGNNVYRGGINADDFIFGAGNDTLFIDEISSVLDEVQNFGNAGVDVIDMRQSGLNFEDLTIENGRPVDGNVHVGFFVSHNGTDIVRLLFSDQTELTEDDFIF